jgi:hypothetical protein
MKKSFLMVCALLGASLGVAACLDSSGSSTSTDSQDEIECDPVFGCTGGGGGGYDTCAPPYSLCNSTTVCCGNYYCQDRLGSPGGGKSCQPG